MKYIAIKYQIEGCDSKPTLLPIKEYYLLIEYIGKLTYFD